MVFPARKARFITFISSSNEKLLVKGILIITPLDNCITPFVKDAWISGITDGKSYFTSSILSNSLGYRLLKMYENLE